MLTVYNLKYKPCKIKINHWFNVIAWYVILYQCVSFLNKYYLILHNYSINYILYCTTQRKKFNKKYNESNLFWKRIDSGFHLINIFPLCEKMVGASVVTMTYHIKQQSDESLRFSMPLGRQTWRWDIKESSATFCGYCFSKKCLTCSGRTNHHYTLIK